MKMFCISMYYSVKFPHSDTKTVGVLFPFLKFITLVSKKDTECWKEHTCSMLEIGTSHFGFKLKGKVVGLLKSWRTKPSLWDLINSLCLLIIENCVFSPIPLYVMYNNALASFTVKAAKVRAFGCGLASRPRAWKQTVDWNARPEPLQEKPLKKNTVAN